MISGRGRPNAQALLAGVLAAPALSLTIAFLSALTLQLPALIASGPHGLLTSLMQGLGGLVLLGLLVTVWGFLPALVFGLAGATASERWLRSDAWWAWGLAGSATSAAYVVAALGGDRVSRQISFAVAPWISLSHYRQNGVDLPAPPIDTDLAGVIVCILISGFAAGVLYFRVSRGGSAAKRADKRM
ncbi:hypothetical protein [uncultured Brevundimonas sp.]|uniref:hypothetical protein n=1 Tax=uncultured Brevundimonas sp. TaxID=213418 RepID=UPI00261E381C|nr:hypothetical protein [uncultured Brevundimonas sp.]